MSEIKYYIDELNIKKKLITKIINIKEEKYNEYYLPLYNRYLELYLKKITKQSQLYVLIHRIILFLSNGYKSFLYSIYELIIDNECEIFINNFLLLD